MYYSLSLSSFHSWNYSWHCTTSSNRQWWVRSSYLSWLLWSFPCLAPRSAWANLWILSSSYYVTLTHCRCRTIGICYQLFSSPGCWRNWTRWCFRLIILELDSFELVLGLTQNDLLHQPHTSWSVFSRYISPNSPWVHLTHLYNNTMHKRPLFINSNYSIYCNYYF